MGAALGLWGSQVRLRISAGGGGQFCREDVVRQEEDESASGQGSEVSGLTSAEKPWWLIWCSEPAPSRAPNSSRSSLSRWL